MRQRERDDSPRLCTCCENFGFCKASCSIAPWNLVVIHDTYTSLKSTTPLGYLLRKRRWVGQDLRIYHVYGESM